MKHQPNSVRMPNMVSGQGVWLKDDCGNIYLDGCSGAIVSNLGHGQVDILRAQSEQATKLSFAFRTQMTTPALLNLKNKILSLCPDYAEVLFFNSGSEAIEAAARIARLFWRSKGRGEKSEILARSISYHGMTEGALRLSGHNRRRVSLPDGLQTLENAVATPYCLRCPFNKKPGACQLECADDLLARVRDQKEATAAFVFEPIVGASGAAIPSPLGYARKVRRILDEHDVLLIADEVMTGFGRIGEWLALSRSEIVADITVLGKGLGAGYAAISAVLISGKIWQGLKESPEGELIFGHTYGGNPVACATALAVIEFLEQNEVLDHVRRLSSILCEALQKLAACYSEFIAEVRGEGFLYGLELSGGLTASKLTAAALDEGLFIYPCTDFLGLGRGEAVLVAPPLISQEIDIQELSVRLNRALKAALEAQDVTTIG